MDYKLDNVNLGLNEKNKLLFDDIKTLTKTNNTVQNYNNMIIEEESEQNINTNSFTMFKNFVSEKDGLIELIKELHA